ncbi:hypothetical protein NA57DRAFT_60934 [Rhizodiscina lignyota]|uniref:Peptidase C14 caspase domain-containing protein n=1 Tax=Rhizodiscina lignyota TaxID=1504668 RepID=A0A9P4I5M7_9PEZI|nr:hypothetical protein NA57DRAFT_60934 [Rhizodiscina lignyota]
MFTVTNTTPPSLTSAIPEPQNPRQLARRFLRRALGSKTGSSLHNLITDTSQSPHRAGDVILKFKKVFWLMFEWKNAPLDQQKNTLKLKEVVTTKFGREATVGHIPVHSDDGSTNAVIKKIDDKLASYGQDKDNLFVLYYSGHGRGEREDHIWATEVQSTGSNQKRTEWVRIHFSDVFKHLVATKSHVLLVLDTCHANAAGAVMRQSFKASQAFSQTPHRRCELLAACASNTTTLGNTDAVFTKALTKVLEDSASGKFDAYTSKIHDKTSEELDMRKKLVHLYDGTPPESSDVLHTNFSETHLPICLGLTTPESISKFKSAFQSTTAPHPQPIGNTYIPLRSDASRTAGSNISNGNTSKPEDGHEQGVQDKDGDSEMMDAPAADANEERKARAAWLREKAERLRKAARQEDPAVAVADPAAVLARARLLTEQAETIEAQCH